MKPVRVLSCGLHVLLTAMRHKLLRAPDFQYKIDLGGAIYDCAQAWDAVRHLDDAPAGWELPKGIAGLACSIASDLDQPQPLCSLVALLDGATTALRITKPGVAVMCRRALESAAKCLGLGHVVPAALAEDDTTGNQPALPRVQWPTLPDRPARMVAAGPAEVANDGSRAGIARSLRWKALNIELTAAELCAAVPLIYPDLPADLDVTLASQTYEEARHARLLLDTAECYQSGPWQPRSGFQIWDNMKQARTLVEAICIEQVLGEGYSTGTDLYLAAAYAERGHQDLAEVFRSVHADEFMHAKQGFAWFVSLAGDRADNTLEVLEPQFANAPPAEPWFRADLRAEIGFLPDQIARQRALAKPAEM